MSPYEPKQRTGTVVRRDGREPLGLGSPVGVQAVAFDADTGRLDVAPAAPAYGTKLLWSGPKLLAAANKKCSKRTSARCMPWPSASVKAGPATAGADRNPQPPAVPAARVQRRTTPEG
ncbi:hypothetical protein [Streptomyces sp. LARHCF252]